MKFIEFIFYTILAVLQQKWSYIMLESIESGNKTFFVAYRLLYLPSFVFKFLKDTVLMTCDKLIFQ